MSRERCGLGIIGSRTSTRSVSTAQRGVMDLCTTSRRAVQLTSPKFYKQELEACVSERLLYVRVATLQYLYL
jgi:hypothetical protein